MKNNTETIAEGIFTCFPSGTPKNSPLSCSKLSCLVVDLVKQKVLTYKNQLQNSLVALGIGTIFLLGIYLFLSQLAKYGWQ